jgi:hypothetical protein
MSYFIFAKDLDNVEGTIYRIAENQDDLNNLNIIQSIYKIIEDSPTNFNLVKFGNKFPKKYNNNVITYTDETVSYALKENLNSYVEGVKTAIKDFTNNNPNHSLFSRWDNYYNQLNNLNLNNISYPLNKSLEQYFNDLGQPSFNPLQIP